MICRYCKSKAIGTEGKGPWSFNVCRDCAHYGATVRLIDGGTWHKRNPESAYMKFIERTNTRKGKEGKVCGQSTKRKDLA